MTYVIILLLTFYFSSRADLLYENITGVLILPEYRLYTMLYIILLACSFGYKVYKIFIEISAPYLYRFTISLSSLIMIIGAIAPYQINSNDFLSNLHVYCCMSASLSILIHLFLYFYYIKFKEIEFYNKYYPYYLKSIEFLIILTIVFGRINGYIEIIFTIIVCFTLYTIEKNK